MCTVSDPEVRSRRFFGVSIARMRPRLMIATRAQSVSTSARLCDVKKNRHRRILLRERRINSRIRAAASGSSERVGSSSKSTGGLANIARATASRCLLPVESSPNRRRATSSNSSFANRSSIRCFATRSREAVKPRKEHQVLFGRQAPVETAFFGSRQTDLRVARVRRASTLS